jgi:amino acid transporter
MGVMAWTMPLFVACSTFGAVNGGIFASSRIFFVGARNGHMPRMMALINVNSKTPMPCLIILVITTYKLCVQNLEPSGIDILTSVRDRDLVKALGSVRNRY